jgi:hypothetical protein
MKRRYICIPTVGKLDTNLQRIRSHIQGRHLAYRYPVVRYERPQRSGGGQLYLFLGLDMEPNEPDRTIPAQDQAFVKQIGFRLQVRELLEEQQITTMTRGKEVSMEGFWFRYQYVEIPLPPPTLEAWDESLGTAEAAVTPGEDPAADERFEHLLWWISARGHGAWADLAAAIQALQVGDAQLSPAAVVRNLVLLGHMESRPLDGAWSVARPCLVTPSLGEGPCFLAGARTCDLAHAETGVDTLVRNPQPDGSGPVRLDLAGNPPPPFSDSQRFGKVSSRLAGLVPNLAAWLDTLPILDRPSLGGGGMERFDGSAWQSDPSITETDFGYRGASGLYRFINTEGSPAWTAFFKIETQRWHRADLTGLKFVALANDAADKLQALLTGAHGDLLIPRSQRWPLLYERALVLASGWLPAVDGAYLRYRSVGSSLARTLTGKLGVRLEED